MREKLIITCTAGLVGLLGLYCLNKYFGGKLRLNGSEVDKMENDREIAFSKGSLHDLTAPITKDTVVFPGDPVFKTEKVVSLESGSNFNLCHMHMGNHTGTHIDFPAHVISSGKTSGDYTLDDLVNHGLIIEVPENNPTVTERFVESQAIFENAFVFFKTRNSKLSKQDKFSKQYVYIEPSAAEALLEKKVKVVGIDYISVDNYEAEDLPVHKILLSNDVLIVEGLELRNVNPGKCKIFIMPLNIPDMDGLPARVMMER